MSEKLSIQELQEMIDYSIGVSGEVVSFCKSDAIQISQFVSMFRDAARPMTDQQAIYWRIGLDLREAIKKHPETDNYDLNKFALVMIEEAGEVAKAVLQYQDEGGSLEDIQNELFQTASMCVRMLLNIKNLPKHYGK